MLQCILGIHRFYKHPHLGQQYLRLHTSFTPNLKKKKDNNGFCSRLVAPLREMEATLITSCRPTKLTEPLMNIRPANLHLTDKSLPPKRHNTHHLHHHPLNNNKKRERCQQFLNHALLDRLASSGHIHVTELQNASPHNAAPAILCQHLYQACNLTEHLGRFVYDLIIFSGDRPNNKFKRQLSGVYCHRVWKGFVKQRDLFVCVCASDEVCNRRELQLLDVINAVRWSLCARGLLIKMASTAYHTRSI